MACANCCITSLICNAPCTDRQAAVPPQSMMNHLTAGLAGAAAGGLAAAEVGGDSAALGRTAPPPGKPGDGLGPPTAPAGLGPCMHSGVRQCIDAWPQRNARQVTLSQGNCFAMSLLPQCTVAAKRGMRHSHHVLIQAVTEVCFGPLAALGCTLSCLCNKNPDG